MVGPQRPQFVLFGSSTVQLSFSNEGWGAHLSHIYSRKADVIIRGYNGWNTRNALQVLSKVFPKDAAVQPDLVVVYFGGNDSILRHPFGLSAHVPLEEYINNMRAIADHLKSLSDKTRVIFLAIAPVNEEQAAANFGNQINRTNEVSKTYSEACLQVARDVGVEAVDLWSAFQKVNGWESSLFTDGVHFSAEGSKIVLDAILEVLMEAEWKPSLYWESMPTEFEEITPFPIPSADGKSTVNVGVGEYTG